MHGTALRRTQGAVSTMALGLLLAGCGGTTPAPLKATEPEVPADLCAVVPVAARAGLVADSHTDDGGAPTAACSLRSPVDTPRPARALVSWLQTADASTAEQVLASQCRAVDPSVYRLRSGFRATGADQACAGTGSAGGLDSATLAARSGPVVVTVRVDATGARAGTSLTRGTQMLEGVLTQLGG